MFSSMQRKAFVLGGNYAQVPYIQELKRRGFKVILADKNKDAPGRNIADQFREIGYDQFSELIGYAKDQELCSSDFVFTAAAQFAHPAAAIIASTYSIRYPDADILRECLDKSRFYRAFGAVNIPIPPTSYIRDYEELLNAINRHGREKVFYLKSDMSKNPTYVYKFRGEEVCDYSFFWGRDRYLNEQYILQEEFRGRGIRINICGEYCNAFDFDSGQKMERTELEDCVGEHRVIEILTDYLRLKGLSSWLVKFDVIVTPSEWTALDIGLDPPSRMLRKYQELGLDFFAEYVGHYESLDSSFTL